MATNEETATDAALAAERAADDKARAALEADLAEARADDAADDALIADLYAQIDALTPDPPADLPTMEIGASHKILTKNNPAPLEALMGLTGDQKLDAFRCYDNGPPKPVWAQSPFGSYVGKRGMWLSNKGDINDWQNPNGANVKAAVAAAKAYDPSWPKMRWTIYHEVQPKLVTRTLTWAQFERMWNNFYNAVRPVAPKNMLLGVIHGGFGWRPGSGETTADGEYSASPATMRKLPVDFYGIDNYGGPRAENIATMSRFQRFVTEMANGDMSKVCIAESGMRQSGLLKYASPPTPEQAEKDGIAWVHRQGDQLGNAGLQLWCMWNSTATTDPGPMTDKQAAAFGDTWKKWSPNRPG